jgi:hypothetical protein
MIKTTIAVLAASLSLNVNAQRAGRSYTVTPPNLAPTTTVPAVVYGSVWNVYYIPLTKLYKSSENTCAKIVKTGNSYSVKVSAFSRTFTYVQTQAGELNLTKTETINISSTVRQILVWSFVTNGYNVTSQCTVQIQTLKNKVWTTTTPSAVWLKSYATIANLDTPV